MNKTESFFNNKGYKIIHSNHEKKEYECTLSFEHEFFNRTNNNYIRHKVERIDDTLIIKLYTDWGKTAFEMTSDTPTVMSKSLLDFILFWEKLIEIERPKIIFLEGDFSSVFGRDYNQTLKNFFNISNLNHIQIRIANLMYKQPKINTSIVIDKDNYYLKQLSHFQEIVTFFTKEQEKDPTANFRLSVNASEIGFYFKGSENNILLNINKDYLTMKIDNKKFTSNNSIDIKKFIEEYFKKLKERIKIKNIMRPPKKYYTIFIKEILKLNSTEIENSIYEQLRETLDWEEIEHFAFQHRKNSENMTIYNESYRLIYAFNKIILYDTKDKWIKIYEKKEVEKVMNYFDKLVLERQKIDNEEKVLKFKSFLNT